jgi:hypothetical protein
VTTDHHDQEDTHMVTKTKTDDRPAVERAATPSPARADGGPVAAPVVDRPERLSQGVLAELEMHGEAVDPMNGRRIVGSSLADARYEAKAK